MVVAFVEVAYDWVFFLRRFAVRVLLVITYPLVVALPRMLEDVGRDRPDDAIFVQAKN